jgi:hypothetical protein
LLLDLPTCASIDVLYAWSFSYAASVMMTHNCCILPETPPVWVMKSFWLGYDCPMVSPMSSFSVVSSSSSIFSHVFSAVAKLTGEFTSLEEPTNDPDIVLVLLADGPSFVRSEGRIKLENLTQKLRLPIVNFVF